MLSSQYNWRPAIADIFHDLRVQLQGLLVVATRYPNGRLDVFPQVPSDYNSFHNIPASLNYTVAIAAHLPELSTILASRNLWNRNSLYEVREHTEHLPSGACIAEVETAMDLINISLSCTGAVIRDTQTLLVWHLGPVHSIVPICTSIQKELLTWSLSDDTSTLTKWEAAAMTNPYNWYPPTSTPSPSLQELALDFAFSEPTEPFTLEPPSLVTVVDSGSDSSGLFASDHTWPGRYLSDTTDLMAKMLQDKMKTLPQAPQVLGSPFLSSTSSSPSSLSHSLSPPLSLPSPIEHSIVPTTCCLADISPGPWPHWPHDALATDDAQMDPDNKLEVDNGGDSDSDDESSASDASGYLSRASSSSICQGDILRLSSPPPTPSTSACSAHTRDSRAPCITGPLSSTSRLFKNSAEALSPHKRRSPLPSVSPPPSASSSSSLPSPQLRPICPLKRSARAPSTHESGLCPSPMSLSDLSEDDFEDEDGGAYDEDEDDDDDDDDYFQGPSRRPAKRARPAAPPSKSTGPRRPRKSATPKSASKNMKGRTKCTFPGCTKTFARAADMVRHLEKAAAHAPPTEPCPGCKDLFCRKDSVKRHMSSCDAIPASKRLEEMARYAAAHELSTRNDVDGVPGRGNKSRRKIKQK